MTKPDVEIIIKATRLPDNQWMLDITQETGKGQDEPSRFELTEILVNTVNIILDEPPTMEYET